MSNRRLIPLGLGAVGLLVIVALAARGGTLHSGGSGSGPSASYTDYAFTTLIAFEILALIGGLWVIWVLRPDVGNRKSTSGGTLRALMIMIAFFALVFYIELAVVPRHIAQIRRELHHAGQGGPPVPGRLKRSKQPVTVQWGEIGLVLALVAAAGGVYVVRRKQLGQVPRLRRLRTAPETVAAALDDSLDDLRSDPDVRRAIVAAYSRMERALAAVGMPREPAEAPLEYVERVLLSLDAGAAAVRRLTELFEWARFSHHEPEPSMRDEAVEALVAVRDELRNTERQAA